MEELVRRHKALAIFIFPGLAVYLYLAGDMTAFACYTIAALFVSLVLCINALNDIEKAKSTDKEIERKYNELLRTGVRNHEDNPYPKDAKILDSYDEALNILNISMDTVDKLQLNADYIKTAKPERLRDSRLHYILKTVNYAIRAQGNEWVAQNREQVLQHLGLNEYSLEHPPRPFPKAIESFDDVLMILDVDSADVEQEMTKELAVSHARDTIQRRGMEWMREHRVQLLAEMQMADEF